MTNDGGTAGEAAPPADRDDPGALLTRADALVGQGRLAEARLAVDEATAIHRRRERAEDEARCAHLAATLCRLDGDLDGATARAERAANLVGPAGPLAVAASAELGEIALARGDGAAAADAFGRALAAGPDAAAEVAFRRKRAAALVAVGRPHDAAHDLAAAHDRAAGAGDHPTARRVQVEQATALGQAGDAAGAELVVAEATRAAAAAGDDHVLADLGLVRAATALGRGDPASARRAAEAARRHALRAVAPVSYLGAAVAIAELAEAAGDRPAAYEALAVGWVTLGDLVGAEVARASFAPRLRHLQQRWGPAAFAEVKAAYEARRRAAPPIGAERDGTSGLSPRGP